MGKKNVSKATSLRQRAEKQLEIKPFLKDEPQSVADTQRLLHELEVHQIELEIQNEELKNAIDKAETATALYDFSPAGYFTLNQDGTLFELNLGAAKMLGADRSVLINRNFKLYISPLSLPTFNEFIRVVFETNLKQSCEVRLIGKENSYCFVQLDGVIFKDGKCLITAVDITLRKRAEKALSLSYPRFQSAMDAGNIAWWEMNFSTGNIICHENKARMLGYQPENFTHYTDFTKLLHPNDYEPAMQAMRDHLVGKIPRYEIEYRIKTADGNYRWFRDIGAISEYDDSGKPLNVTGIVIDITDRKQTEFELMSEKNHLKTIIDASPASIWFKDTQNNFIHINLSAAKIANRSIEEVVGHSADEIFPEQSEKYYADDQDVIKSGKAKLGIIEPAVANGISTWVRTDKIPWFDTDRNIAGIIAFALDITDRVESEKALRVSKLQLQSIIQAIPDLIWLKDKDGKYMLCNTMFERFFGAIEAEIVSKTDYDFVDHELADFFRKNDIKAMIAGESAQNEEWLTFTDDGHRGLFETTKTPVYDSEGTLIGVLGIAHDITRHMQMEESLKESQQLFENLAQISPVGIFRTSADGYTTYVNPQWSELSGLSFNEAIGYGWLDAVHPDERERLRNSWNSDIEIQHASNAEYRFLKKDGSIVWVIGNAVAEMKDNIIVGFIGTITDITGRKISEDIIRQERILLRTLIDSLPDTIYIKDNKGRKLIANSSDLQIMNRHTESDVIGKTDLEIFSSDIGVTGYEEDMSVLKTGQSLINHEDYFIDATGKQHWRLTSKIPIYDAERQIVGLVGLGHDITERKKSEELLKESEERFRSFFENATIGIYRTTQEGEILLANPALVKMLGYESFEDLASRKLEIANFALARARFRSQIEREGEVKGVEFEWRRKDNSIVSVRENAKVFRDNEGHIRYYEGMVENITERKDAEKEVKLLAHSLESISECVSITDNNDILIYVNESFLTTYGYAKNELIGQHVSVLRTSDIAHEQVRDILPETIEGGWRGEIMNKRKDGTIFPILLSTSVIKDENDKAVALIGVAIDVTQMRKNRDELVAAKDNAEESNRLKTAFLAMMNHELRTPLNHILGFSELILSGVAPEESHSFAASIQSSGQNLLAIIEDVFELAMIEQGNIKLRNQTYSFMDHFMETKASFDNILRTSAKNEQIQLVFKPDVHFLSSYVTADRSKINKVLTNLFKNAVKFTQKGKIEFGFTISNESNLTFYIKDTGIGIPIEKQGVIFDYFRQGDDSYTRSYGGIGIGLAISLKIAKILSGDLGVVSEPGVGSTFSLTIPVELSKN